MKQKEKTPLDDGEELNRKLSELSREETEKIFGGGGTELTGLRLRAGRTVNIAETD